MRAIVRLVAPAVLALLLFASTPAVAASGWTALNRDASGAPIRWNPCGRIYYVTNLAGGPWFSRLELGYAIEQIERASGLDFVWAGNTTEVASGLRPLTAARYGSGYSPVLISFATAAQLWLPSTASGWGAPLIDTVNGRRRYVTGQVALRPDHGWTKGITTANPLRVMFQHELGHLVGLGHVSSRSEVMPTAGNGTRDTWGLGDKAGLRALGRSTACS